MSCDGTASSPPLPRCCRQSWLQTAALPPGLSSDDGLHNIYPSHKAGLLQDSSDKDTVKVPDIVGMTEEEATKALKDKNLGIKVDSREDSEKYEEGTVSEQKTKAGTKVKKHSTVHVVVSSNICHLLHKTLS